MGVSSLAFCSRTKRVMLPKGKDPVAAQIPQKKEAVKRSHWERGNPLSQPLIQLYQTIRIKKRSVVTMWELAKRDTGVWTILTYALVRGNHQWQHWLDAVALLCAGLVIGVRI